MQDTEKASPESQEAAIRARISTLEAALAQSQQQYQQVQANIFMLQGAIAEKKCDLEALSAPVVGQVTQDQLNAATATKSPLIVEDCKPEGAQANG